MYPHQTSIWKATYRSKFLLQAKGCPSRNRENCREKKKKEWAHEKSFLTVFYEGGFLTEILLCCFVKEELRRYQQSCWSGTKPHLGYCWDSYNVKWVSWKKCFATSASADIRKWNINAFKGPSQELVIFWACVKVLKLGPYSVVGR